MKSTGASFLLFPVILEATKGYNQEKDKIGAML